MKIVNNIELIESLFAYCLPFWSNFADTIEFFIWTCYTSYLFDAHAKPGS